MPVKSKEDLEMGTREVQARKPVRGYCTSLRRDRGHRTVVVRTEGKERFQRYGGDRLSRSWYLIGHSGLGRGGRVQADIRIIGLGTGVLVLFTERRKKGRIAGWELAGGEEASAALWRDMAGQARGQRRTLTCGSGCLLSVQGTVGPVKLEGKHMPRNTYVQALLWASQFSSSCQSGEPGNLVPDARTPSQPLAAARQLGAFCNGLCLKDPSIWL